MAFFDKVGATISSIGNDVSSKTKSLVEVSNLSGQLKNCEDSLKSYYAEIGKIYYERFAANPEPELQEQFDKVKEAKEAIEHLQLSICRAKGVKICSGCGIEVPFDTVFCPNCGAKIDGSSIINTVEEQKEIVPESAAKCSKCGERLKPGAVFCASCGTKVE
ncbi:MAG TPA: zinc ribbon domain-containing protein [Lachnospiraceae bacterium]|nr:zinc ribbon domain-containing protein [Lachnospiraceae bacterium]